MDEEAGVPVDGHEMLEWEVLGMFKTDQPVDDDVSEGRRLAHHVSMEEQAVSAESGEHVVDGAGRTVERSGNLSVGHAAYGEGENPSQQIGSFEPVGGLEGLSGERFAAVQATVSLHLAGLFLAVEEADASVFPFLGLGCVVGALGVGAVGRFPIGFVVLSVHGLRPGKPAAILNCLGTIHTSIELIQLF